MPPFEYRPFVNPYVGAIADLMGRGDMAKAESLRRRGEIDAQAAEQRGNAWSGAIQNLANIVPKAMSDYHGYKEMEFQDEQRQLLREKQQDEKKAMSAYNEMASTADVEGLRFVNVPGTPDSPSQPGVLASKQSLPTISHPYKDLAVGGIRGLNLWDVEASRKKFAQSGITPQSAEVYLQLMRGSNAGMEAHHASAVKLAKESAGGLLQLNSSALPSAVDELLQKFSDNGVFSAKDLAFQRNQVDAMKQLPPAEQAVAYKKFLLQVSGREAKFIEGSPGNYLYNIDTGAVELRVPGTVSGDTSPASTGVDMVVTMPDGAEVIERVNYFPARQGQDPIYTLRGKDVTNSVSPVPDDPKNETLIMLGRKAAAGDKAAIATLRLIGPIVSTADSSGASILRPRVDVAAEGGSSPLSATERGEVRQLKDGLAAMDDIMKMLNSNAVDEHGNTEWQRAARGVGGFGQGTVAKMLSEQASLSTPEAEKLRGLIGRISAQSMFGTGGKALTPSEQKILSAFLVNINIAAGTNVQRLMEAIRLGKRKLAEFNLPSAAATGALTPLQVELSKRRAQ